MADLIAAFERASVAASEKPLFHAMCMKYPVADLIPDGTLPCLGVPMHIDYREKPAENTYLLRESELGLDYRSRPSYTVPGPSSTLMADRFAPAELVKLVDSLLDIAGSSELDMAYYEDQDDGDPVYVFRLSTVLQSGHSKEWHFWYKPHEFDKLHNLAKDREWLSLMLSIVDRASDRAYLHVEKALKAAWPEVARSDLALLEDRWNSKIVPTANDLMMCNLPHVHEDGVVLLSELDRENWEHHADESLRVWLPCGHEDQLSYKQIISLTEQDCLQVRCTECAIPILADSDLTLFTITDQKRIRNAFRTESGYWAPLDTPVSDSKLQLQVKTAKVAEALIEALESLRAPDSATPYCLNQINFPETAAVMGSLRELLHASGTDFSSTPLELIDGMENQGVRAIADFAGSKDPGATRLPADYWPFLGRWLTRTVNSVVKASTPAAKGSMDEVERLMRDTTMDTS